MEFADRTQLNALVEEITLHIEKLLKSFATGQAVKNGIPVVIVGPPNAGKSTLLNALLEEKAIVSPIAGTTRDVIEDKMVIDGIQFRFVDTAGLRHTTDLVESIGISRTREQLDKAAFVLLLESPDSEKDEVILIEEEIQKKALPYLKIPTKSDLRPQDNVSGSSLSAVTGEGMEKLKNEIVRRAIR